MPTSVLEEKPSADLQYVSRESKLVSPNKQKVLKKTLGRTCDVVKLTPGGHGCDTGDRTWEVHRFGTYCNWSMEQFGLMGVMF